MFFREFFLLNNLLNDKNCLPLSPQKNAQMAELVDALVSGTSVRKDVQVRVLFWVHQSLPRWWNW